MSLLPILWAMKSAPVVDAEERGILIALAESAWSDGTDAFPSKKTVAQIAVVDPKTVQRRLKTLAARHLIAEGNQDAAAYIPEWSRPKVYDLLIPYSWFPDIEQINAERKARGKAPLTPENRPDMAPAPPKKHRADKGKPRKKQTPNSRGGDYKSPRDNFPENGHEGGTTSPGGGDYKSHTGGLQDPQPSPSNPPQEPLRPSFPENGPTATDGGTDGSGAARMNPGVELLLAIGAEQPAFLLTGKTLSDQGLTVGGMLLEGWTPQQLRQVIAGRPLPDNVRASVGAIVARRLRDALSGPAPHSVSRLPEQAVWRAGKGDGTPTPTPDLWGTQEAMHALDIRPGECVGNNGLCGRPISGGEPLCRSCVRSNMREDVTA